MWLHRPVWVWPGRKLPKTHFLMTRLLSIHYLIAVENSNDNDFSSSSTLLKDPHCLLPTVLRRWSWCWSYFVWLRGLNYVAFHVESCLALSSRIFSALLALWSPRLGKRELVYVFNVHLFCTSYFLSFFSSSWCQGLAVSCDCGTPWTFLLPVLLFADGQSPVRYSIKFQSGHSCNIVIPALTRHCDVFKRHERCRIWRRERSAIISHE